MRSEAEVEQGNDDGLVVCQGCSSLEAGNAMEPTSHTSRSSVEPLSYLCLKSSEEVEFIIPEPVARQSKMLSMLLDAVYSLPDRGGFEENKIRTPGVYASNNVGIMPCIPLEALPCDIVELVCRYLIQRSTDDVNSTDEFLFLKEMNPTSLNDQATVAALLLAADYLDC
ncbi:hypothetical protein TRVL_04778 [Trypanosoma vivax]|nr:hypothetical protein TRVL_04778 [Trypanosoma vivax]